MLADHLVHFARLKVLEPRPAKIGVGALPDVLAFGKVAALYRQLERRGLLFLQNSLLKFKAILLPGLVSFLIGDYPECDFPGEDSSPHRHS